MLGDIKTWQVYVLAALRGCVLVFDAPARQALTTRWSGRQELPNAVALNSSLFNGARVAGPAAGGVVVALFGPGALLRGERRSFLAVLGCLLAMRVRDLVPLDRGEPPAIFAGTWEALRYARRQKRVRLVLLLVLVVSTFAFNFNVLLPVLAKDTLGAGPEVFGILSASFGAGALIGALLSATIARASLRILLAGTAGFGLAELLLAPAQTVALASVLLCATGSASRSGRRTPTRRSSSARRTGSADGSLGLYFYAFMGAQPIGGLFSGWLADTGGTSLAFAVGGAVTLVATGIAFVRLGAIPRLGLVGLRPKT